MKFTTKTCLPVLVSAILFCLNAPASAEGNRYNEGGYFSGNHPINGLGLGTPASTTNTNLSATLSATGSTGTGLVRYSSNSNGGSLQAHVHLPVDGTTILDSNTAVKNAYTLTISNGASVVATYTLAISELDFTYNTATSAPNEFAEYVLAAAESGTTYTVNLGSSTSTTLPALAANDTVTISLNGTTVLSGTLAATLGY